MRLFLFAFFLFSLTSSTLSYAGEEEDALIKLAQPKNTGLFSYMPATAQTLSKLYWALGRMDMNNDTYIDNYLLINECDIYKNYHQNEFEWETIRKFARQQIKTDKDKFPLRFEFIQPLRLSEYNFEKHGFDVNPEYSIDGIRRFEIRSLDYYTDTCGYKGAIFGYPKAVFLELSRPVFFEILPMSPDNAKSYIQSKTTEYKNLSLGEQYRTKAYSFRDIYLILKVKFFANAGIHRGINDNTEFAKLLGVLEGIEVYDDINRETLLFSESYQRNRRSNENYMEKLRKNTESEKDQAPQDNSTSSPK